MKYRNCIFDLYGTLVDIHTDETSDALWENTAAIYKSHGAVYTPYELREAYWRLVSQAENGMASGQQDSHEAHPEIQLEYVFQKLFMKKGVYADLELAVHTGQAFRKFSTEYIRLYDGVPELLRSLRENGQGVWLLSNAQSCFTMMELKELELLPLFDGICLSSDYGCKKPSLRFFSMFLNKFKVNHGDSIMVGNDGVCDIWGAKAVGLSTLYIHSNLSPLEAVPAADYVLGSVNLKAAQKILQQM